MSFTSEQKVFYSFSGKIWKRGIRAHLLAARGLPVVNSLILFLPFASPTTVAEVKFPL